ncbi:MAG: hypothetical protein DRP62_07805, partial [Planctomycetota bacterium]
MDDEYAAFGSNSVEGFFQSLGAKEIVGGKGEITLDSEYLSWVQDILLGGYWTDDYSYVEIPVFDNSSGEWVTLVFTTYSEVNESELPLVQGNASTLGIYSYRGRRSVPRGHYTTLTRRVSVSVAVKKGHSRTVVHRTSVKKVGSAKWHHTAARAKKSMCSGSLLKKSRVIKTNNGRMMIPRHRTRPIHSGSSSSSSSLSSSSSSASSSSSSDYSSKISKYKREIEKAKRTALSSFVIADKVISKIYGGYIAAKNKLKSAIYAAFNWAWGCPASSIWAAIEGHVLKGVDWLLSKISQDHRFKSLISVAYNMIKAGKSGWELAMVLIGWGVAKFASGVLHYFGDIANWLLSKFGDAGKWVIKLMRGWTDSALSFVDSKLAYFEKTLKDSLASIGKTLGGLLFVVASLLKEKISSIIKNIVNKIKACINKSSDAISTILLSMSKFLSEIVDAVKAISTAFTVINIVQALVEVATAGIGAVVTRIIIPLVAAVIINEAAPQIIKSVSGMKATFSFAPLTAEDVISIVTGGFGGLLEVILPRILGVSMVLSIVKYVKDYAPALSTVVTALLGIAVHPIFLVYLLAQNLMLFLFHKDLEDILKSKEKADTVYSHFLSDYSAAVDMVGTVTPQSIRRDIFTEYPMGPQSGSGNSNSGSKKTTNNTAENIQFDNITLFKLYYLGYEAMTSSMLQFISFTWALYKLSRTGTAKIEFTGAKRAVPFIIAAIVGSLGEAFALRRAASLAHINLSKISKKDITQLTGIGTKYTYLGLIFGITASIILSIGKVTSKKKLIDTAEDLRDNKGDIKGNLFYRLYRGIAAKTATLRRAIFNKIYLLLGLDAAASSMMYAVYLIVMFQKFSGLDTSPIMNSTRDGSIIIEDGLLNIFLGHMGVIEAVIGCEAIAEAAWEGVSRNKEAPNKAAEIIKKILDYVKKKIYKVYRARNKKREIEKISKDVSEEIADS